MSFERAGKAAVQVIPFDAGAHAAQDSSFVFLEFNETELSPIVCVEGLVRNSYHDRKNDIARYREAIDYLRDFALSPRDSMALIDKMRQAYAEGRTP